MWKVSSITLHHYNKAWNSNADTLWRAQSLSHHTDGAGGKTSPPGGALETRNLAPKTGAIRVGSRLFVLVREIFYPQRHDN